jgi:hypothetical protein
MNLSLILGGLSMALLNFSTKSKVPAVLFSLLSLSMMTYALYRYLDRIDKLEERARGRERGRDGLDYSDNWGVRFLLVRWMG